MSLKWSRWYTGLTRNVGSHNPVTLTFHEARALWRDVIRPGPLRHRLMYLFGPPGWRPSTAPAARRHAWRLRRARGRAGAGRAARHAAGALQVVARRTPWRSLQAGRHSPSDTGAVAPQAAHRTFNDHRHN